MEPNQAPGDGSQCGNTHPVGSESEHNVLVYVVVLTDCDVSETTNMCSTIPADVFSPMLLTQIFPNCRSALTDAGQYG